MSNPTHEPLKKKKEMHEAEREIDAIENKIANADYSDTYPADYAAMRAEQETQRQRALKSKAEIDDQVMADQAGDHPKEHMVDDYEPFLMRQRTPEELADYDAGFIAGEDGKENDDTKSFAWRRGWGEAQE
jgi:hypothetical protein